MEYVAPTMNEIVFMKEDCQERRKRLSPTIYLTQPKYSVGERVEFVFCGTKRIGRVTTIVYRNGMNLYNIETLQHQWFKKISQADIIAKIN